MVLLEEFKCKECEKTFSMEKSLQQHLGHKHRQKNESISAHTVDSGSSNKKFIAVIVLSVLAFGGFVFFILPSNSGVAVSSTGNFLAATAHNNSVPTQRVGNNVGDKAPDFTVSTTDGEIISLSDYSKQGKPVVVEFMATWCPFCSQDLSAVKEVYPQYSEESEFIAISLDQRESASVLQNYKTQNGYPVTFAPGSPQILRDYAVTFTTTKYAIDKDGIIIFKSTGAQNSESWKTLFNALVSS